MWDQTTVVQLLREISSKLDTLITGQSSLISMQQSIDKLITVACLCIITFTFFTIVRSWCRK